MEEKKQIYKNDKKYIRSTIASIKITFLMYIKLSLS